jgi:RecA-family ATPase
MLIPLSDILARADTPPDWLCDPFLPRRGITYLHGKTSIGKSPLTWELARCVSQGLDFFGHTTTASKVLYIEADGALELLSPRLKLLPQPVGTWHWAFLAGTSPDLANDGHSVHQRLAGYQAQLAPGLVIWNTLRQFYKGPANDSDTVPRVYGAMLRAFPQAGHLVIAHDKKAASAEHPTPDEENFSGSGAWRDLATVALHLAPRGTVHGPYLALEHTKSQVSELCEPLKYTLDADGTRIHPLAHPLGPRLLTLMARRGVSVLDAETVTQAMKELKCSRKTLFRVLASVRES